MPAGARDLFHQLGAVGGARSVISVTPARRGTSTSQG